jgi:hypothetical protein
MAEVTFFYSLHCSLPPALRPRLEKQCVLRALENLDDASPCKCEVFLASKTARRHRSIKMPITTNQIVKDRSREIRRPAVYCGRPKRLSLAVLMDRGQARLSGGHSSRLAIELGLWPRFNDALASILSSTLTNGEGGNYTGVAKPCKGAARDFECGPTGRIPAAETLARGAVAIAIIKLWQVPTRAGKKIRPTMIDSRCGLGTSGIPPAICGKNDSAGTAVRAI